ncbi:MAG: LPS biosynthesis protein [Firmicutes bacterium]|nr:LPS biosynthesis protein [Bacillota bacterium]
MKIERNPIEVAAMKAFNEGDFEAGRRLEGEFVRQFREAYAEADHCSCEEPCRWHGNCKECVAIHRAHQDHLPHCFEKLKVNPWYKED